MTDLRYAEAAEPHPAPPEAAPLPDHLIRPRPGGMAYWRCVGLRGAGFPVTDAVRLAAPEAAATADALLDAESGLVEANRVLLASIDEALDELRREGRWDDAGARNPLTAARARARAGKAPAGGLPPSVAGAAAEARGARERLAAAGAEFERGHEAALRATAAVLRELAGSDAMREAISWQNPQVLSRALDPLLDEEAGRGFKQRQRESLLASYVQRYCVKNDTIGFFGPVGWAELVSQGAPLVSRPGPRLLASRHTYFEMWGIEALAAWISSQEAYHPWLKPQRNPTLRVEGTTLHHPVYGTIPIPVADAAVLAMCDGKRTGRDIARVLLRLPRTALRDEAGVYRHLVDLDRRGLIQFSVFIPYDPFPERLLRSWIDGVGDEGARAEALARLDALEAARDDVGAAAGDWRGLAAALRRLDEKFTELTGTAPTRAAGQMYAARTLVYEDCRRDVEVRLGPSLLGQLDEPLSLLLRSARWLTVECAAICKTEVRQIYDELVASDGSPVVDGARFWARLSERFFGEHPAAFDPAIEELKRRWDSLLATDPSTRRFTASAADLRPRVEAAFPARAPGWRMARYHSPDVMIAAADEEAVARGDFQLVLGECHLNLNTLAATLFVNQHPSPETLVAATGWDMGGEHVMPVQPKGFGEVTARTARGLISPRAFRLEWSRESMDPRDSRRLPVSALVIQDVDGELVGRTRDGAHEFPMLDLIGDPLGGIFTHSFGVLTEGRYVPRRTIDRLVISRETWRFPPGELAFAFEKKEADRFLGLRRWARSHGMPRFVFAKASGERKPVYVDLDSAVYAEAFAKLVRASAEQGGPDDLVTVSEMLPGPGELWLRDAEGRPHVSELRIVVVDLGDEQDPAGGPDA